MTYDTLIQADALASLLQSGQPLLVADCTFDLADPAAGRRAFDAAHIPGAVYVDLDATLSARKTGTNGRHPLPTREAFVASIAALGADNDTQIVAYDGNGGVYAARLWWMLKWAGHAAGAVLDGGIGAWRAAGHAVTDTRSTAPSRGRFSLRTPLVSTVDHASVRSNLGSHDKLVVDARSPDRFRGENETLDPIGGHIPGASNRFFRSNLGADGRFKSADALRGEFDALLAGRSPSTIVHQCGSGVTACHNLLAMAVAGLDGAALYPGSWSEWIAQPGAPIATGASPDTGTL